MSEPATDKRLEELQVGHWSASRPAAVISQTIIWQPALDGRVVFVSMMKPNARSSEHRFQ
jgi:hypothetical protein